MLKRPPIRLLLAACLLLSPSALPAQDDTPSSIEDLIERYRTHSEAALEGLRAEAEYLLEQLSSHTKAELTKPMAQVRAKLIALGAEAGPLLVQSLDPGRTSDRAALSYSTQIALVLQESSLVPIHDYLFQLSASGSIAGRRLAISVLGYSDDPSRIGPALRDLYLGDGAPPKVAILTALARIGGPANLNFVTDRLRSDERVEVGAAITALAATNTCSAADQLLAFCTDTPAAVAHVQPLIAWYKSCPDSVDKHHAASILRLAKSQRLDAGDRIAFINLLVVHEKSWPSNMKKDLRQMAESGNRELREAVLVALAISGERRAKRELIEPYERALSRNSFWNDAWIDLAKIEYRIHEYRDAIKHYEAAVKMGRIDTRRQRDVYLGLARCYARLGKYKDAKPWLQRAPISRSQLAALATDPDFQEMAAHTRYSSVFTSE